MIETATNDRQESSNVEIDTVNVKEQSSRYPVHSTRRSIERYIIAERLILDKLFKEYGGVFKEKIITVSETQRLIFDGVYQKLGKFIAVEVKYFSGRKDMSQRYLESINKVENMFPAFPYDIKHKFSLILAIGYDEASAQNELLENYLKNSTRKSVFPIEIRFFNLKELEGEIS